MSLRGLLVFLYCFKYSGLRVAKPANSISFCLKGLGGFGGLDMRFFGRKTRKKCKGKDKGNKSVASFQPFGRAVRPSARLFRHGFTPCP